LGTGTLSSGKATYTTSTLTAGSHSITASYGGNTTYNASTSSTLTQTVNKANSTTTLASSANPSIYGSSVKFTATVTASTCTGTVTFKDGTTTLGTGTLSSGKATFTTSTLTAGSHSIIGSYAGDSNCNSSASSGLTQTVNKANTTTTLSSSSNPSAYGSPVMFTATSVLDDRHRNRDLQRRQHNNRHWQRKRWNRNFQYFDSYGWLSFNYRGL
jgi:hypothetical protein